MIPLNGFHRWFLRSKLVFLAFGAGLLFLFSNGSSEFGSGGSHNPETGVDSWESYRIHRTGVPAWVEQRERTWGEERREPDGTVNRVGLGAESEGRIIWTSLAWLYPLSFAALFCLREWWLLREARRATPVELANAN